jgi:site-specific recombinase XerD
MALEDFFCSRSALRRYRLPPLGPEVDEFCGWLRRQGYRRTVVRRYVWQVSRFNLYLRRRRIKDSRDVERRLAERFIRNHFARYRRGACSKTVHVETAAAVRCFLRYLSSRGILRASVEIPRLYQKLLDDYLGYLKRERNLAETTIRVRRRHLIPFLEDLGADAVPGRLANLLPERVHSFLAKGRPDSRPISRATQATLRTFFRFCIQQGYLKHDLTQAVPSIRTYKLSGIPRAVSEEDAQKVLHRIDRTTPTGRRDFAIIQLLYTYGVRGCQVRCLKLQDIEWRQGRIRFSGFKGGKEVVEPLTHEVGDSLLDYLRQGRPDCKYPEVFLTAIAPFQPLRASGNVTTIVGDRIRRAGVTSCPKGSHVFRHAFAGRMLQHGQSLKTIADLLGHRNINTTFIYTKVDLETLKQLPLEWPEEVS